VSIWTWVTGMQQHLLDRQARGLIDDLLRHGIGHMSALLAGLSQWLVARGVAAIGDIRGRTSRQRIDDPTDFDRANYLKILQGGPPVPDTRPAIGEVLPLPP
jgi:hypothetical protein